MVHIFIDLHTHTAGPTQDNKAINAARPHPNANPACVGRTSVPSERALSPFTLRSSTDPSLSVRYKSGLSFRSSSRSPSQGIARPGSRSHRQPTRPLDPFFQDTPIANYDSDVPAREGLSPT
ncbi:hypothetical protein SCP_1403540 [Sparassis crispa]|uniref:Uncharacterized protein n=1 Tax=Sparassis crispa TaxID=139825 RepID=A0A401H3D0_9APHY|nr:hypothetical protein SCP_1403540 [Sparassis crispa]GBE88946.1 hypothetical protein SCP_1403540 [Sparassis crispa]